jgi:hypothetical protein
MNFSLVKSKDFVDDRTRSLGVGCDELIHVFEPDINEQAVME